MACVLSFKVMPRSAWAASSNGQFHMNFHTFLARAAHAWCVTRRHAKACLSYVASSRKVWPLV
eukprot:295913-Chlamydomonas_euryale.AAC.4